MADSRGWRGLTVQTQKLTHVLDKDVVRLGIHEVESQLVDDDDLGLLPFLPARLTNMLLNLGA
jgi:hypothetical protein